MCRFLLSLEFRTVVVFALIMSRFLLSSGIQPFQSDELQHEMLEVQVMLVHILAKNEINVGEKIICFLI